MGPESLEAKKKKQNKTQKNEREQLERFKGSLHIPINQPS